ncbi:hypothetical protein HH310_02225 [Actinoplanes sp. TBRC 11911]|uniref:hypothetical protein n=1 Tax=Actinoplanes sp. TBRC 11911 TaxID=2729386 RepID=UPI00145C79C4|nr:hypothetical protein [Actinoplanes sp. TBRC 11911]NMO50012.1 hypothetical protein [Actinoplanes sp. TBRC 11911]
MSMYPDLMLAIAYDRHREMIADGQRERLLASARRARKARRVRGQPTGTLAACEPSAVVPAR